jgi:hypothetical protein
VAHYAFLDEDNIVTEVITGIDETELIEGLDTETWYGNFRGQVCKRTSYNGNIRKNYAGLGYSYNEDLDAFVPPKPFDSWILNEETCLWQAPVDYPTDGFNHTWNEESLSWYLIENSRPPESWVFNENTIRWEPPVAYPDDGKKYAWDEETISWKIVVLND